MSTNKKVDDRVMDKIKKCLALSKSPEPAEAAAALRQAQKLMEHYGISMTDLSVADIGHLIVKSKSAVSKVKPYELRIVNTVARAFGCELVWTSGNSYAADPFGYFTFIGMKSQIEVASYTAQVLLRKHTAARAKFTQALPKFASREFKVMQADGFSMGWATAIAKTVQEFAGGEELKNAILVYKTKMYGADLKTAEAQKKKLGATGYAAGEEAARGESLYRPMEGNGQGPLQLRHNQ